jgi:large subunit ribosomal protein L21
MFAVIETGGKQYTVVKGETLKVEKLELATGAAVDFPVLMLANGDKVQVGAPHVKGGMVKAEVVGHGRGDKVKIIKFRRRKHFRKQMGHRQWFTEVKITDIALA